MTTLYLIRHSVRMKMSEISSYNANQSKRIMNEKIILSPEGERRAELLSQKIELQGIDAVYTSNCVRTLQTAKYLLEKQNLKANIDERLDERRTGESNSDIYPDWFQRQYFNENFKTEGGESQKEVRERMDSVISEILNKHKGERIAVFSHGYAITFYILKYCDLINVEEKNLIIAYNKRIVLNRPVNAPEVFKLTFNDDNEFANIEVIEFDDIPFNLGI